MADVGGIAADRLRLLIERIERLEVEVADLNADKRDVYAEAKAAGFDVKVMKKIITLRRLGRDERQEQDHLLDLYRAALGIE